MFGFIESGFRRGPLFLLSEVDMTLAMNIENDVEDLERRLVMETGLARRVAELAEPVLEGLGYRLVRVRITGQSGCTVQIMAERPDGTMTIDDCEQFSRAFSPVLEVEDPVPSGYVLEVSSPGVDRPLVRPADFERWAGYEAKIEMVELLADRRRFRGVIEGYEDGEVRLFFEAEKGQEPVVIGLPIDGIAEARLVMTDQLVRESLKKQNAGAACAPEHQE